MTNLLDENEGNPIPSANRLKLYVVNAEPKAKFQEMLMFLPETAY